MDLLAYALIALMLCAIIGIIVITTRKIGLPVGPLLQPLRSRMTKLTAKAVNAKFTVIAVLVGIVWLLAKSFAIDPIVELVGPWMVYVMYTVLGLLGILLAYLIFKKFWGKGNKEIPKWVAHEAILAGVVVLILIWITSVVAPTFFARWLGGPNGLLFGAVAVVGASLATLLMKKEVPSILWLGVVILALSPAILATEPGVKIARFYERAMGDDFDIDQNGYRQRKLTDYRKSIELDAYAWETGVLGAGCFGEKYTRGVFDPEPVFLVSCVRETPNETRWPADWGKMPAVGAGPSESEKKRLAYATRVEVVALSGKEVLVYAKRLGGK